MAGHIASSSSISWNTPSSVLDAVRTALGSIDLDPCSNSGSIVNARVEYVLPVNDGLMDPWLQPGVRNAYVNPPFGAYFMDAQKRIVLPKDMKDICERGCYYVNKETGNILSYVAAEKFDCWGPDFSNSYHCREFRSDEDDETSFKKEANEFKALFTRHSIKDWARKTVEEHQKGLEVIVLIPAQPGTAAWQLYIHKHKKAVCNLKGRLKFIGAKAGAPMDCVAVYFGPRADKFKNAFQHLGHVDLFT